MPAPAWTKVIDGAAYTVKRIGDDRFGIWRDVEELGTFELYSDPSEALRPGYADDLSLEARAVVREFVSDYRDGAPEGPARRAD